VNHLAKWKGNEWSPVGTGLELSGNVVALAFNGTELFAGGISIFGLTVNGIAKFDGTEWTALGGGLNSFADVRSIAVSGTNAYVGGLFSQAGGVHATNVARWDGRRWWPLGKGINGVVYALAASGSNVYVGVCSPWREESARRTLPVGWFTVVGAGRRRQCIGQLHCRSRR
jgi:hypothetical protein